jgi:hypothetical protein
MIKKTETIKGMLETNVAICNSLVIIRLISLQINNKTPTVITI